MNFSAKCFLLFLLVIHCVSAQAWRSTLYPENWTPDATYTSGRFLHDVSYAGYHRGELPIPTRAGAPVFDVVKGFGGDATGGSDTTASIQAAIDAAAVAGGGIVYLPAGLYRCDGKLDVTASNTLIPNYTYELTTNCGLACTYYTGNNNNHVQVKSRLSVPLMMINFKRLLLCQTGKD